MICPVPAHVTYKRDTNEQCCAPLRAGGNPATVHCEDGIMLYIAENSEDDDTNDLSHGRMSYVEDASWETHGDDNASDSSHGRVSYVEQTSW